ncbi:MAG: hypothetical protein ACYC3H_01500 [Bellilinea sp.]
MANLRRAFERRLDKKQDALPAMPGILGDPAGQVGTPIPNVVYVQVAQTVTTAICTTVPHIAGLPVWVGYAPHMPDKLQVISQRIIGGAGTEETQAGVTRHAASHEWDGVGAIGGTDVVKVHLQQFMPLRVFPYTGLTVAVYPGMAFGASGWMTVADTNVFGMPVPKTLDLQFDSPTTADKSRYILITIDTSGALVKTLGTEVDSTALTLSDIPAAPAGTLLMLAAVRLYFGQTELVENRNGTDIVDLRWPGETPGNDADAIHVDVAGEIAAITEKTTPADADVFLQEDSAASNTKKRISWANIKATLKTYFDTLYAIAAAGVTNGDAHDHSGGDGAQINHTTLSNIGTNTHATLDAFVASKAAASGLASLNASSLVVQNPANATATPTASKIPIADASGKLDGWVTNAVGARVYNSAAQTLTTSGALYVLNFNSERQDDAAYHNNVTNNTRLTVPAAGWYLIGGECAFDPNTVGVRDVGIRLNGTTIIGFQRAQAVSDTGRGTDLQVMTLYYLAATNYVEMVARQYSGGALDTTVSANNSPEFWIIRIK